MHLTLPDAWQLGQVLGARRALITLALDLVSVTQGWRPTVGLF